MMGMLKCGQDVVYLHISTRSIIALGCSFGYHSYQFSIRITSQDVERCFCFFFHVVMTYMVRQHLCHWIWQHSNICSIPHSCYEVLLCSLLFYCPKLELPGLNSHEKSRSSANEKSSKQRSHLWPSQTKPSAFTQSRN
jgi:hypothetical protein